MAYVHPVLTPVILAGGKGERLWPLSRKQYPKQIVPLLTEKSLLQETTRRVEVPSLFRPPLVICDEDSRFIIHDQLEGRPLNNVIIEPVGRNTAAASAVAALYLLEENADALMLLLPSDHHVADNKAFIHAVGKAVEVARSGKLVTFGIVPDRPETGYGYILQGEPYNEEGDCFIVDGFKEKPDKALAEEYVQSGNYLWNSGIFLLPATLYLQELERFCPDTLTQVRAALEGAEQDLGFIRLAKAPFAACEAISIDYAVMENTQHAVVVPVSMGWSDLGAWDALLSADNKDNHGNACIGDVITVDCHHNYLRSEGKLLAAVGLEHMMVVSTSDALLVAPLSKSQEIKSLTKQLIQEGRKEAESHVTVFRPWGSYTTLVTQPHFQVKRIIVKQGGRLSLQSHYHRSEHWIVVKGTAKVTCGEKTFLLHESESTYIPTAIKHRLENPGRIALELIEVQSGSYLGEDDIIRYDDVYGR